MKTGVSFAIEGTVDYRTGNGLCCYSLKRSGLLPQSPARGVHYPAISTSLPCWFQQLVGGCKNTGPTASPLGSGHPASPSLGILVSSMV